MPFKVRLIREVTFIYEVRFIYSGLFMKSGSVNSPRIPAGIFSATSGKESIYRDLLEIRTNIERSANISLSS